VTTKLEAIEIKTNEIDKRQAVIDEIVNKFNTSIDKLFCTLDNLDQTLQRVQLSMTSMQAEIKANADGLLEVKTKINELDGNSKFNIVAFINSKLIPLILGAGIVYLIMCVH
jgi:chromosome segregation ATPase